MIRRYEIELKKGDITRAFGGSLSTKKLVEELMENTTVNEVVFLTNGVVASYEEVKVAEGIVSKPNLKSYVEGRTGNIIFNESDEELPNLISGFLNLDGQNPERKERNVVLKFSYNNENYEMELSLFKDINCLNYINNFSLEKTTFSNGFPFVLTREYYTNVYFKNDSTFSSLRNILSLSVLLFHNQEELKQFASNLANNLNFFDNDEIWVLTEEEAFDPVALPCQLQERVWDCFICSSNSSNSLYSKIIKMCKRMLNCGILPKPELMLSSCFCACLDKDVFAFKYDGEITYNEERVPFVFEWNGKKIKSNLKKCSYCGSLIKDKDELFTLASGQIVCKNCLLEQTRVLSYHDGAVWNPQPSCGSAPSEKTRYGIELESVRNNSSPEWNERWAEKIAPLIYSDGNLAHLEEDGSLPWEGEELITQPLNKIQIKGEFGKKLLEGYKELYHPTRECGLHVHVDKDALTDAQWGKMIIYLSKNYNKFVEKDIFRPENGYNCLDALKKATKIGNENPLSVYDYFINHCTHYSSLSFSGHTGNTMEFRCFESTNEYQKFSKSLNSIMFLMDNIDSLYDGNSEIKIERNSE